MYNSKVFSTLDAMLKAWVTAAYAQRLLLVAIQDNWEWHRIEVAKDAPQPSARDFACIVALEGGRLLVHGGLDAGERRLDDTWVFDTVT